MKNTKLGLISGFLGYGISFFGMIGLGIYFNSIGKWELSLILVFLILMSMSMLLISSHQSDKEVEELKLRFKNKESKNHSGTNK